MSQSNSFVFILNGNVYGTGNADYMSELFSDYVATHQLYGRDSIDVKIETIESFTARHKDAKKALFEENNENDIAAGDEIEITCINGVEIEPVVRTITHIDHQTDTMCVDTPIEYDSPKGKRRTLIVEHPNWMYNDTWTRV